MPINYFSKNAKTPQKTKKCVWSVFGK